MQYRLADLMRLVNEQTSKYYRERLILQERQEEEIRHRIMAIFCQNTNKANGFRMESNLAYTNINLIEVEEQLHRSFHIILSPIERLSLGTVQDYVEHILFKLREGGAI